MLFTLIQPDQVKIQLTAHEAKQLKIDCTGKAATLHPAAIATLLDQAKRQVGFAPHTGQLLAIWYPSQTGCTIYLSVTASGCRQTPYADAFAAHLYRFPTLQRVIDAAVSLFLAFGHHIYQSFLYHMPDGCYWLAVRFLDARPVLCQPLLEEYGQYLGSGRLLTAYAAEHGQTVIAQNAVDTLYLYFS